MRLMLTTCLLCLAALPLSAQAELIAQDKEPKKDRDAAAVFSKRDANGDGKLSLEEFKSGMKDRGLAKADQRFKKFDADGNGSISLEEFKAVMESRSKKDA
jgi:Ca2+-binding EF-hand superfamily protein